MDSAADITDARVIKALGHPLRVRILRELEGEVGSPVELSRKLGAPLGVVSYHVRYLADLGLVRLVGQTPRRGAVENHYRAEPLPRLGHTTIGTLPKSVRRSRAGAVLREISEIVDGAARSGAIEAEDAILSLTTAYLDDKARSELSSELDQLRDRVERLERQTRKRRKAAKRKREVAARPTSIVTMVFDASDRKGSGRNTSSASS